VRNNRIENKIREQGIRSVRSACALEGGGLDQRVGGQIRESEGDEIKK